MEKNTIKKEEVISDQIIIEEEKSEALMHKDNSLQRLDTSILKHIELQQSKKTNYIA